MPAMKPGYTQWTSSYMHVCTQSVCYTRIGRLYILQKVLFCFPTNTILSEVYMFTLCLLVLFHCAYMGVL